MFNLRFKKAAASLLAAMMLVTCSVSALAVTRQAKNVGGGAVETYALASQIITIPKDEMVGAGLGIEMGPGDGTGGGGQGSKPLCLDATTDIDHVEGSKVEIPTVCDPNAKISMRFSNNVSEQSIRVNNANAITLKYSDGREVEESKYKIAYCDDLTMRRFIQVRGAGLNSGKYFIELNKGLKAKNGRNLDKPYTICFIVK